jgi:hypothetical protein
LGALGALAAAIVLAVGWPRAAQAAADGQIDVIVRVVGALGPGGGALPLTGGSAWLAAWAVAAAAAGAALIIARRTARTGARTGARAVALTALAVALGGGIGVATLGGGAAQAAGAEPVIVVDKAKSLTGSAEVALDLTALGSKVFRVDGAVPAVAGIALAYDGVALSPAKTKIARVEAADANGIVTGRLTATVASGLAPGDHRLTLTYGGTDERVVINSVAAAFADRNYDGTTEIAPEPGSIVLAGAAAADHVELAAPEFRTAGKDVGAQAVVLSETGGLTGADAWRYRLAPAPAFSATVAITPKPITFRGLITASKLVGEPDPATVEASALRVQHASHFMGLAPGEGFSLVAEWAEGVDFGTAAEVVVPEPVSYSSGRFRLAEPVGGALASNYVLRTPHLFGEVVQPIELEIVTTAPGQAVYLTHYWTNDYLVDWGDGGLKLPMTGDVGVSVGHTYAQPGTYTVSLVSGLNQLQRWTWDTDNPGVAPLILNTTTADRVDLTAMPALRAFLEDESTAPGGFFAFFNFEGALQSLPPGSFDTSGITETGKEFFQGFNELGKLTALPEGSFRTDALEATGIGCFRGFNKGGALIALPEGSFDTSHVVLHLEEADGFFEAFNQDGALADLPASFKWPLIPADVNEAFENAFNSPSTALDRSATELVAGLPTPDDPRNTFSSNQPGWADLDPNWQAS